MYKLILIWSLLTLQMGCTTHQTEKLSVDIQHLTHAEWVMTQQEILTPTNPKILLGSQTTHKDVESSKGISYIFNIDGKFEVLNGKENPALSTSHKAITCSGWWSIAENSTIVLQFSEGGILYWNVIQLSDNKLIISLKQNIESKIEHRIRRVYKNILTSSSQMIHPK